MNNEYTEAIVIYIDLLGIKNEITEVSFDRLYSIYKTLEKITVLSDGNSWRMFSDTAIRIFHLNELRTKDILYLFQNLSIEIQTELIRTNNITCRGSIVVGNIFDENDIIFGPALVKANEIAEKKGNPPIIKIDNSVIDYIRSKIYIDNDPLINPAAKSILSRDEFIDAFLEGSTLVDQNHGRYLNYAYAPACCMFEDDFKKYRDFLHLHKDLIDHGLKSEDNGVKQKYEWLKNYHIQVIQRRYIEEQNKNLKLKSDEEYNSLITF